LDLYKDSAQRRPTGRISGFSKAQRLPILDSANASKRNQRMDGSRKTTFQFRLYGRFYHPPKPFVCCHEMARLSDQLNQARWSYHPSL